MTGKNHPKERTGQSIPGHDKAHAPKETAQVASHISGTKHTTEKATKNLG